MVTHLVRMYTQSLQSTMNCSFQSGIARAYPSLGFAKIDARRTGLHKLDILRPSPLED